MVSDIDVRIRPLRCGVLRAPGTVFVSGLEGAVTLQVWAFLIMHPRGVVLFDTGMHPALRDDPRSHLGALADLFELDYGPDDDVSSVLGAAELAPDDIDVIIASHLHFDHAGGNVLVPNSRVLVQRAELDHARTADEGGGYVRSVWDTGHDLQVVDGEHDVFGDGRVVCVPTFGHTPGHQSLLVRLGGGDVVLTADACYLRQSLERRALPGFGWDLDRQRRVLDRFALLEAGGATLVFGHDPDLSPAARALLES